MRNPGSDAIQRILDHRDEMRGGGMVRVELQRPQLAVGERF
jgi:hypothetical protein